MTQSGERGLPQSAFQEFHSFLLRREPGDIHTTMERKANWEGAMIYFSEIGFRI